MDNDAKTPGERGAPMVLVVDDEPILRADICEHLRSVGFRALEARDAQEAIQILDKYEPVHLVFSDVQMPGMDGIGLQRWIRERRPHVKVLLASGVDTIKAASGYLGPPRWIVFKPYDLAEVERRIRALVSGPDLINATPQAGD